MTEDEVKAAVQAFNKAIEDAHAVRDAAIARALNEGMKQADVVRATGYAREHIRRIARAQGIEPSR